MGFLNNIFKSSNSKPNIEKLKSERDIKGLIDFLQYDDPTLPQGEAIAALQEIGDGETVDMLIDAINKRYDNSSFLYQAFKALGKMGDEKAVETSIKALDYKASEGVPVSAAEALGNIGDKKAVEPLINALNHEWKYTRKEAAISLGKIGGDKATDALINLLAKDDPSGEVQKTTAEALGKIGNEKSVDVLITALSRKRDSLIRDGAINALVELKTPKAVDPLIRVLNDNFFGTRRNAALALGEIGDKKAIESLTKLLNDKEPVVRESAAKALEKLGFEPSSEKEKAVILFAFKKWDELEKAGDAGIETLVEFLNDGTYVKEKIMLTLEKIGEPAVERIIEALKNYNWYVRDNASQVLTKIGSKRAIDPMIALLQSRNKHDRITAAFRLGKFKDKKAIEPLKKCLNDSDQNVKSNAEKSLKELEGI